MKPDAERLLDEVLGEDVSPDFRAGLLTGTLKQARRRKQFRRWNRGLLMAALVVAAWVWSRKPRTIVEVERAATQKSLEIIMSKPMNPASIIVSSPGLAKEINSSGHGFAIIETDPSIRHFRELDDDQLMALTAGKPSMLVRQGPHEAELLVVDSTGIVSAVEAFNH
jgi:hypothetical protein